MNTSGGTMSTINDILTNQFFLIFLAVGTGMLIGKIKIGHFSLGVSGGIFTGIVIGYFATAWANNVQEGAVGYSNASRILSSGVVAQVFFNFFLFLFLAAIGLRVGKNIGTIFRRYGAKFVVIGAAIPAVSILISILLFSTVFRASDVNPYQTIGMYSGAMTSTPAYGTGLDAADSIDIASYYDSADDSAKAEVLRLIDSSGNLTPENTPSLSQEQIETYHTSADADISLGYTVAFPIGVLVIVLLISFMPKMFRIDIEEEKKKYALEIQNAPKPTREISDGPLNYIAFSIVILIGIAIGNIVIPLGPAGQFSLGAAGGILITALILSHIGKIGPLNFRMDAKALGILSQMGLIFFMAVVGLRYGYDVVQALTGSGLILAIGAIFVEGIAVFVAFLIGHKIFKLNWVILSGAITGGCTSAPGLGAAISSINSDEPSTGYGASQPFAILTNVILTTLFFTLFL